MPAVGSLAPEIHGVSTDLKELSLNDFKGKKKVICFVPSLDTSVCSTSAKKFNEKIGTLKGCAIIYCSMDLPFAQKRACEAYTHVTPLSLFRNRDVAKHYGLLQADGPLRGLCARAVFVLDEENRILYRELVPEITQEPNYSAALWSLGR